MLAFLILPMAIGEEVDPAVAHAWQGQSWVGDDRSSGNSAPVSSSDTPVINLNGTNEDYYLMSLIFQETFDKLDNWHLVVYNSAGGSENDSASRLDHDMGDPSPSLDVNGDSWCGNGAYSKKPFDYTKGLTIEFDMYVASGYDWNWGRVGLSDHMPNPEDKREDGAYVDPLRCDPSFVAYVMFNDDGDHNRRPPLLHFGILAEDGKSDYYTYSTNATELQNQWHRYRIEILPNGYVEFYMDGYHVWTSRKKIDQTLSPMPLVLGSRDAYGPVRVDNVVVYAKIPYSSPRNGEKPPESDQPSTLTNQPPRVITLTPSVSCPQEVETTVTWTADATDPENDSIYYKFWFSGPRTEGEWLVVQDWSQSNVWTWHPGDEDVGSSDIRVWIRNGRHAGTTDMDDFCDYSGYQIRFEQLTHLDVEVANAVYTEEDRRVYYCEEGGYSYVKNRIYLTGPDLDKVKKVQYVLHETFPNPVRVSEDPSNNFEIWIWTWGRFPIKAIITTKTGQQFEKDYSFSFRSKVDEARRRGIPMVIRCDWS